MGKKIIKLTESDLRRIVEESTKRVLKEGHSEQEVYNEWEDIREQIGDEAMLMELWNYLDGDTIEDFIGCVKRDYDLDYEG